MQNLEIYKEYCESFINYLDVNELTLNAYKYAIDNFSNYLKENNIKKPIRNDIISYRDYLRANYSSNTVNTYMIAVRSLFKYLEINNLYKNIAKDIKGSNYSDIPVKQIIQKDKIKEIYKSLTDLEEKAMWSLLFTTGIRGCELANANIEDIKEHNGEIVLFILGKKRDSKCEYVKLSMQVLEDIKNYIKDRTSGAIFISTSNRNKNGRLTTKSVRLKIKQIFKRYGLEDNTFSLHTTRRSFAVLSYENGSNIYDIQQVLHHKNISTTTRYLQQVNRDNNKTEYNVSNVILGS